ncbi:DUF58 domain-containing protein [Malonomonas rubra]|uniref:DUF58 domain-containing protein n=1 Tax=Malonomonas rubra TaxID=57040 RepID=UPI0026EEAFC1|nr:DUF58 domain-containing protein [Malonomonas rubra]
MAISGLLGQQNLQRLAVKVIPLDDLFANLSGRVELELENRRRWLPAFLISVEIGSGATLFPLLPSRHCQRQPLSLTLSERGYQPLPEIWVRSCFPINFFVRSRCIFIEQQLLVFPKPLAAELPSGGTASQQSRRREMPQPGIDGELRSVDSYRPSDPLKSIHWKLSARQNEYIVKRQTRLGAPSLLLNLEDFTGPLEQRLGQCAFLINRLISQQQAVGLQMTDLLIPPAGGRNQRLKLLTELALYGRR